MTTISKEEKLIDLRKKLSIELCDNFTHRLNPAQTCEVKLGAIIAIKNFIKESQIDDPILLSFLVDTIVDPDKKIRDMVVKVIKDVIINPNICLDISELLEIKLKEIDNNEAKKEIRELLSRFSIPQSF